MTCSDWFITANANEIGFFTFVTPDTAPALSVLPHIIEASISLIFLLEKTDPFPALNSGEFSRTIIDFSTASRLDPPLFKIS